LFVHLQNNLLRVVHFPLLLSCFRADPPPTIIKLLAAGPPPDFFRWGPPRLPVKTPLSCLKYVLPISFKKTGPPDISSRLSPILYFFFCSLETPIPPPFFFIVLEVPFFDFQTSPLSDPFIVFSINLAFLRDLLDRSFFLSVRRTLEDSPPSPLVSFYLFPG